MKTYQDWEKVKDGSDAERIAFVKACINEHKSDPEVKFAKDAQAYDDGLNPTLMRYKKYIYNAFGQKVADEVSANHKITSQIFGRINTQAVLTQLGNGVSFNNEDTADKLENTDHLFLTELMDLYRTALIQKVAYGFWNLDHLETYEFTEFKELVDEEDGAIKAGVRFWQLDETKPLRATLFELDGYTDIIWEKGKEDGEILHEKRPYIISVRSNEVDGEEIYDGANYPTFPIIPLYLNKSKISSLVGLQGKIDAMDLIASGYCNDVDDMNIIYWTVTNAGGMADTDIINVLDKLRKLHMAQLDDDQQLQSHTVDMPYLSREAILDRLEKQIYKDAMALNVYDLASGAITATQIKAAYEPLNEKLDMQEVYLTGFIKKVLRLAGIDDDPSYTRSIIVNSTEEIGAVVSAALYLDEEYVMEKVMTILGDADKIDLYKDKMDADNLERMAAGSEEEEGESEAEYSVLEDFLSQLEGVLSEGEE